MLVHLREFIGGGVDGECVLIFLRIVDRVALLRLYLAPAGVGAVVYDLLFLRIHKGAVLFRAAKLVRVLAQRDGVVARVEHVALGVFIVVRGHLFDGEGQGVVFGFLRLQDVRLVIRGEDDFCLFDGADVAIALIAVRGVIVQLDDVFAGIPALGLGIGDGDGDAELPVVCDGRLFDDLLEGAVAQAVAEGIGDGFVIVDKALFGGGLVIAVANVDALFILHRIGGGKRVGRIDVGEGHGIGVHEGGIRGHVRHPCIHRAAGGIDGAVEDLCQSVVAAGAGVGHPDDGIDALILRQGVDLHDVGAVDEHDDRIEIALRQRDEVLFLLRKLQLVLVVCIVGDLRHRAVHGRRAV